MKKLSTEKTMTVKEVAKVLGVGESTITKRIKKIYPLLASNGKTIYLNETQVTVIKRSLFDTNPHLGRSSEVKTDLEKELLIQQAMIFQQEKIQSLEIINSQQSKKIEKDQPKVEFYNTVADSQDAFDMSTVAKLIKKNIGRNNLFIFLRDKKILRHNNEPYQKYMEWFKVIEQEHERPNGKVKVSFKTLVTQKGIDKIIKLLDANL